MRKVLPLLLLLCWMPAWAVKTHVQIADENAKSIVAVNVAKNDGSTFTGTGFVVSPDGLIATSRHVPADSIYMNVTFNTGAVSGEAKLVAQSQEVDLALIKIQAQNLPTVILSDASHVVPGQEITVIGNPRRLQNTVSSGLISQVRQKANGVLWHQISAPISPSSSGSPVFNEDGEVVSIVFGSYKGEGNQNLNFSVPSNYLIELMDSIGYLPPVRQEMNDSRPAGNPIIRHIQKSWQILKRLFSKNKPPQS